MPAKLALEAVNHCFVTETVGIAYKMPAAKATDTLSFFWIGSFRCQMVHSGRSRIRTSDRTLIAPVTMRLRFVSTQVPWIDLFHALCTGLHWKMTDNTLAR